MKIDNIIKELRSIKPVTNLQQAALSWAVATLYHRQQEIDRATQEQKRAEAPRSTTSRTISRRSNAD